MPSIRALAGASVHLERLTLTNFRCFGPIPETITFGPGLTAFVGYNGSGKTAAMQALLRLFGITSEERRIRRQDFHASGEAGAPPKSGDLSIDAVFAFPELAGPHSSAAKTVPAFFQHMSSDESGVLKCRIRLEATWTDDGTLDGHIEAKLRVVRTLADSFGEADVHDISAVDRGRIQVVYVPAVRDGLSQVASFLRGRLWRAIQWSKGVQGVLETAGTALNDAFNAEPAVKAMADAIALRWKEVHFGGTDAQPLLRPIDLRLSEFVRKVEVVFHPDEQGRERGLAELSDGQRSLFHIALTAAILDVEAGAGASPKSGFQADSIPLSTLTLLAVEEPENNLAPFYLARIVKQLEELCAGGRAQAMVSSHSPSILARVAPSSVRHFRLRSETRTALVRPIRLPQDEEEASKFIREAVQAYPELYFARFVVLGEGSSEEVVLPRLASALGFPIDRSFVAVVPLGGRHVNHLWRLLADLDVPHATLLDLDAGRFGGGWGRIKDVCNELLAMGTAPEKVLGPELGSAKPDEFLSQLGQQTIDVKQMKQMKVWVERLQTFGVYFCWPLDLDWSMLLAFREAYRVLPLGLNGPSAVGNAKAGVLGAGGTPDLYPAKFDEDFRWYRYLFLGRGKPSTHLRALTTISTGELKKAAPKELVSLLMDVKARLEAAPPPDEGC